MARHVRPLTDAAIRKLKRPTNKRPNRLHDGRGLYFFRSVTRDTWRLRLRDEAGRERWLMLGEYPAMSLAEARRAAEEARLRQAPASVTFGEAAQRWLAHVEPTVTPKTMANFRRWLERDTLPYIGAKPCDEVQPRELVQLVKRVEARGTVFTAHRLLTVIRRVFSYAIAHGDAGRNPAAELNVGDLFKKEQRQHRPAFTTREDAGMLMRLIREYPQPVVRGALLMLAWTLSRPGEVRAMSWEDVDWKRAQWRYVVSKTNTPHAVPLPRQAMALLEEMRELTGGSGWVFPGCRPGRTLSDNTLNQALRTMGVDTRTQHCAHGFRAMGRTLLAEMGYKPEAIERQLCHRQPSDTVAAYAREKLLDERTEMMQTWADTLDAWADGADVLPLRRRG